MSNDTEFLLEYSNLCTAGVGVAVCRTNEPLRLRELLYHSTTTSKTPKKFKSWSPSRGWVDWKTYAEDTVHDIFDLKNDQATVGFVAALLSMIDKDKTKKTTKFGNGIFTMMYPHLLQMDKNPVIIDLLKEFSQLFSGTDDRLLLLVPPSFILPPELRRDIPIIDFDTPSVEENLSVLNNILSDVGENYRPSYSDEELLQLANIGSGMTAQEFETAIAVGLTTHKALLPNLPVGNLLQYLAKSKTDIVKRSEVLELLEPEPMENIGGLELLKEWINDRVCCFSEEAKEAGVDAPKGIALFGPSGTGKTACAKAIASVLKVPLIKFDVGRVFNSLVGQSEARVNEALKMVDKLAPCVLLLDEVDKAFQTGGSGDGGVAQRVLGAILTWMQETSSPVFMVVTGNRVKRLPSELLRKGRLDEIFSVTIPSKTEIRAIMSIHLVKRGVKIEDFEGLEVAVTAADGCVAAEIEAAVVEAHREAFGTKKPMTGEMIKKHLGVTTPIAVAFAEDFEEMREWAEKNARPSSLKEEVAPVQVAKVRTRTARSLALGEDREG